MDWRKAKNYIIALLVILNLILLLSIVGHNNNASVDNPYFSQSALQDFEQLLALHQVELIAELPHTTYSLGTMSVEYLSMDEQNFPLLYENFDEITTLENKKKIRVFLQKTELPDPLDHNLNTSEGQRRFAENFLAEYFPERRFSLKQFEGGFWEYNPIIHQLIFEESYVRFEFGSTTVTVEAIMIDAREEAVQKRSAITSVEAILNALPELETGDLIIRIDLIYYFNLNDEELYKLKNARAIPHWRIITEDRKVIYTSAFRS